MFGPASESPGSFWVTLLPPRSIPSPAFEKTLLPLIALPVPSATTMPAPPFSAITFPAPAAEPPIEFWLAPPQNAMPLPALGTALDPVLSVPT